MLRMEKKKIGILTFHCSNNYGAVLQAYALRETLQDIYKNLEVHVLDYRCEATITKTSFQDLVKKKGFLRAILHYGQIHRMACQFENFRSEYLNLTEPIYSKDELEKCTSNYEAVISGSDQVWNLKWTNGDLVYLQDFNSRDNSRFSYAASFGFDSLSPELIGLYTKYLRRFSKISVREESAKKIVEEQLNLDAERHIDPTLLLTKEQWSNICCERKIKQKYILLYMVPKQNSVTAYAKRLSKRTGLPIVILSKNLSPFFAKHVGTSSPQEFVEWIKNAEYVVTNSFHGTAFSIIFHRKLCLELENTRGFNIRSKNLLDICKIQYDSDESFAVLNNVMWSAVEQHIEHERIKSKEYLSSFLL